MLLHKCICASKAALLYRDEERSSEAPVLLVNEPKITGARSAGGRVACSKATSNKETNVDVVMKHVKASFFYLPISVTFSFQMFEDDFCDGPTLFISLYERIQRPKKLTFRSP